MVANSRKAELVTLAKAAASLGLPRNVDHQEDHFDMQEKLTIKGTRVPDPFSIPQNHFTSRLNHVPPFGIVDIFNILIFKSSDYNRQKIASYKAFEEYGLIQDGQVEELRVKELDSCHFVFVGRNFIISDSEDDGFEDDKSETQQQTDPFIFKKVKILLQNGNTSCFQFLSELKISEAERAVIESTTRGQGQFWKVQRQGFVTSMKIKDAFSRQKAIDADSKKIGDSVAKRLLETDSMSKYSKLPAQLQYGSDNESEDSKEYKKLMTTTHSNFKLQASWLQVCTKHLFVAASPDNIRS
eukprot:gene13476-14871_t